MLESVFTTPTVFMSKLRSIAATDDLQGNFVYFACNPAWLNGLPGLELGAGNSE